MAQNAFDKVTGQTFKWKTNLPCAFFWGEVRGVGVGSGVCRSSIVSKLVMVLKIWGRAPNQYWVMQSATFKIPLTLYGSFLGSWGICVCRYLLLFCLGDLACLSRGGTGDTAVHYHIKSLYHYRCTSGSWEMHLQWFLGGDSPRWTLNVKELCLRKQICLALTLSLHLFGDKDREKTVPLQTVLIHSSDGVNGLITPLLINEWEKCLHSQPMFPILPSPAAGCPSAGWWVGRGKMERDAESKLLGSFGVLFVIPEDLMHGCLNPPPSFLLGRCWIAQVCSAGRRRAPLPAFCSLGIGVARSLSGATPRDTAGLDAAWLSPEGARQKPLDTRWGGRWKLLDLRCSCPAPLTASLCKWRFPGATTLRADCVIDVLWWRLCSGS